MSPKNSENSVSVFGEHSSFFKNFFQLAKFSIFFFFFRNDSSVNFMVFFFMFFFQFLITLSHSIGTSGSGTWLVELVFLSSLALKWKYTVNRTLIYEIAIWRILQFNRSILRAHKVNAKIRTNRLKNLFYGLYFSLSHLFVPPSAVSKSVKYLLIRWLQHLARKKMYDE